MEIKMKIEKYLLAIGEAKQNIDIGGAMPTILSISEQDGNLVMWAQLEENYPGSFNIDVYIVKTGQSYHIPGPNKYAGSAVMPNGDEWHVFTNTNYIRAVEN